MSASFTELTLNTPTAAGALQFYADLRLQRQVALIESPDELTALGAQNLFGAWATGRLGMYIGYFADAGNLRQATFDWDVTILPRGSAGRMSLLHGFGRAVAAGSKLVDEAWELLKWTVNPEMLTLATQAGNVQPSRRSVLESKVFLEAKEPPASRRVIVDSLQYLKRRPITTRWDDMIKLIQPALMPVWRGQATAKQAADSIKPQIDLLLKDAQRA